MSYYTTYKSLHFDHCWMHMITKVLMLTWTCLKDYHTISWPQMSIDLQRKQQESSSSPLAWSVFKLYSWSYNVYKFSRNWPLLTWKELWPPQKTSSTQLVIHKMDPNAKCDFIPPLLLFARFSDFDQCWPHMTIDLQKRVSRVLVLT